MFYGLGMQELLVILAIVMLLFGGKKLPEVGRNLGKAIRGFKESEEETARELKRASEEEKAFETAKYEEEDSADKGKAEDEKGGEETEAKKDDQAT